MALLVRLLSIFTKLLRALCKAMELPAAQVQVIVKTQPARGGGDGDEIRVTIREEIKKMSEQKKRRKSFIIRG